VDPKEDRPTRVGVERSADGKRVRVTKRSSSRIES
jgi:Ribosomal proteins 50S L24/mitochondrial 39S L24